MDRKTIIGIDCGVNGGIAFKDNNVYSSGDTAPGAIVALSMPRDIKGIERLLETIVNDIPCLTKIHVYIEDVPPFVGANRPAARIFKLAENFGIIKGMCQMAGYPYTLVRPAVWMKQLGTKKRKDFPNDNKWKNHLKKQAQYSFPSVKPTLKTADALLILEYGLQMEMIKDRKKNE